MVREATSRSRQEILRTAARLFQQRGLRCDFHERRGCSPEAEQGRTLSSLQEQRTKILFHLMDHAMDISWERVVNPVQGIADAEERLRA